MGAWCYHSWRALFLPRLQLVMTLVFIRQPIIISFMFRSRHYPSSPNGPCPFYLEIGIEEAIDSRSGFKRFSQNIINVYHSGIRLSTSTSWQWLRDRHGSNLMPSRPGLIMATPAARCLYLQGKLFFVGKMFHTGWISVYDMHRTHWVGGYLRFQFALSFCDRVDLFLRAMRIALSSFPLYVWIHCTVTTGLAAFYTVFGNFSQSFTTASVTPS